MKTLIINPHSFVDIITNSSTVIYTYVNSEQAVKDIMNAVIASIPNVTLSADDLFDFKVILSDGAVERLVEKILDSEDTDDARYVALKKIEKEFFDENPDAKPWEAHKFQRSWILENLVDEDFEGYSTGWSYYTPQTRLVVTPKTSGVREDIGNLLMNVFSHEAEYNG